SGPNCAGCNALIVVGKPADVLPVMYALPKASAAIAAATSSPVPPRYVENRRAEPAAFSLVTKASRHGMVWQVPPPKTGWNALAVVGKLADLVSPVTKASPAEFTARPRALFRRRPPG